MSRITQSLHAAAEMGFPLLEPMCSTTMILLIAVTIVVTAVITSIGNISINSMSGRRNLQPSLLALPL